MPYPSPGSIANMKSSVQPSLDPQFVSHSIRVLVAASIRPEMSESLADSPAKLLFATSLVESIVLALLGKCMPRKSDGNC